MEWRKANKQYQPYKEKIWKNKYSKEARLVLNNKNNKILHIQELIQKEHTSDEEESADDEMNQEKKTENEGLWYL